MGVRGSRWRGIWRAQQPGQRSCTDGHHRSHDGLRHHGYRARPRPRQDQEVGRWWHDVDRQPDDSACAASSRLHPAANRRCHRLHRHEQEHHRCAGPQARAPARVRVLDGRQHDPLRGSRPHDGCGAAVPVGRHLEDGQHARRGDHRRDREVARVVVASRPEGRCDLPRQLQGGPAAVDCQEGRRQDRRTGGSGHRRRREDRRACGRSAGASEAAAFASRSYVRVPCGRLQGFRNDR